MERSVSWVAMLLALPVAALAADADERVQRQQKLDDACELAREKMLAPLRGEFVEECVKQQGRERAYCERFYSDYGDRSGNRAPLFYDLPECVRAFEFRRSYRRTD